MSPRTKITAAVLGCAVVAGGAFAATEAFSGPGAAPAAASTASGSVQGAASTAGTSSGAAVLSSALADVSASPSGTATSPSGTATTSAQQKANQRRGRRALARLRLLGGEHGEFTFAAKTGPRTLAFERGTVASVAGSNVSVKAKDGTTWTWTLVGNSVIREDGKREASSTLHAGQQVFAGGPVTGTTRDARLLVIRDNS
jgi:hypothetical protein